MFTPNSSGRLSRWFSHSFRSGSARWGTVAALAAAGCAAILVASNKDAAAQKQREQSVPANQTDAVQRIIEIPVDDPSIVLLGGEGDGTPEGGCPQETATHSTHDFVDDPFIAQAGFVAQEVAAVTFTLNPASFPIRIDRVEGIFGTQSLSVNTTTHWTMMVWEGQPNNGNLLCTVSGCTITSDGDNPPHMVLGPPNNAAVLQVLVDPSDPKQIIVTNNGSNMFSVGFRIDQMNSPPVQNCGICSTPAPCCPHNTNANVFPTVDVGGLHHAAQNWLFARPNCGVCTLPGGWYTFQQLASLGSAPSGDWNIRAVFTPAGCVQPVGACCLPSGQCLPDLTSAQCAAQGGNYQGNDSTCAMVDCPLPMGTCCLPSGNCTVTTEGDCANQGGTFLVLGQICTINTCRGACCVPATQQCVFTTEANCIAANGVFQGFGTNCTNACFGACCLPSGDCTMAIGADDCANQGGTWQGGGVSCESANCPQPTGACCLGTTCLADVTEVDCTVGFNGQWLGANTTCEPNLCDPTGACCLGTTCLNDLTQSECTVGFGGVWQGAGSTCSPNTCSASSCPADVAPSGGDGTVNVQDLLAIINAWGSCPQPCPPTCAGDINSDCSVNVQDLLAVINAWGPCP